MSMEYIRKRITDLRLQKGTSARDMSLSLGQNVGYINKIENGDAQISIQGLEYVCEYFQLTMQEFFDESNPAPAELNDIITDLKQLDTEDRGYIAVLAKRLARS